MKKIETVDIFLLNKLGRGEISLKDAAREFCRCGWTNFVDIEATKRYLNRAKVYDSKRNS